MPTPLLPSLPFVLPLLLVVLRLFRSKRILRNSRAKTSYVLERNDVTASGIIGTYLANVGTSRNFILEGEWRNENVAPERVLKFLVHRPKPGDPKMSPSPSFLDGSNYCIEMHHVISEAFDNKTGQQDRSKETMLKLVYRYYSFINSNLTYS